MWKHKLLVTIHDLNHLLDATYRNSWRSRIYAKPLLKLAVKMADVIVVPSNYTKTMLDRYLNVSPNRVTVISCPVSQDFYPKDKIQSRSNIRRDYGIRQPYLLFVGSMMPNKNVPLLLNAFSRLRHLRRDAPILVIVGGGGNRKREMQIYANTLGLQDAVVWLEDLSNASLAEMYSAALMTIMPSLEEGFGLPVIESMACGTPVICSEAASLPEVAGDASFFFSPHSSEHLTETIVRLMDSTDEQKKLIASGLARSRMYSQENFTLRQALVIRELLSV
jgi:alpha-1,3-rhamnosyl/mannosyltransferase